MKNNLILIIIVIVVILVVIFFGRCNKDESYRNITQAWNSQNISACEFNESCLGDSARTVQLSSGIEGVCTLDGIACPSFSQDHIALSNLGMSPDQVDDRYMQKMHEGFEIPSEYYQYLDDPSYPYDPILGMRGVTYPTYDGTGALDLGMYPTDSG